MPDIKILDQALLIILVIGLLAVVMVAIDRHLVRRHGIRKLTPVELRLFNGLLNLRSEKHLACGIREFQRNPTDDVFFQLLRELRAQAKDHIDAVADVIGEELTALLFHHTLKLNDKGRR